MLGNTLVQINISYSLWIKNKARGGTLYYARVKERGRPVYDIPLHTPDITIARDWVRLRKDELAMYNHFVRLNEQPPAEICRRLVRYDNRLIRCEITQPLSQTLNDYYRYMESKGLRATSLEDSRRCLEAIFRRAKVPLELPAPEITVDFVGRLVQGYNGLSDQSRRGYGSKLRNWISWLIKVDKNGVDPMALDMIPSVKCDKRSHLTWSMEEMMKVCQHAPDLPTKAYWLVMATTGARCQELGLARWKDLDGDRLKLRAETTKGRRSRTLPLDHRIVAMLESFRGEVAPESLIFAAVPDSNSKRNAAIKQACLDANVTIGTNHTFRHSAARYYFKDKGMDIKDISSLLGHADEATTLAIYLESTAEDVLTSKVQDALVDVDINGDCTATQGPQL